MKKPFKKTIKESSVQTSIRNYLKMDGWFVTKLIATSTNGIPDLLAIKKNRTMFIEVKTEVGVVSPLQEQRIKELQEQKIEVYVVRSLKQFKTIINGSN